MIAVIESAFSWYTLTAVLVYYALAFAVHRRIKTCHPALHERFGARPISAAEQWRFLTFLFGFRYLKERDATLSILAMLMQVTMLAALYLIFTHPIYYSSHD